MSSHPPQPAKSSSDDGERRPMTLPRLAEMHRAGEPIVMVTAYDYPSAQVVEEAGVDLVLVGDSGAMVVLGYPGTEFVSMDEMLTLTKAVRRGLRRPLLVGDLPMGSYEASDEQAILSAQRMVKEGGCQVVKLESGGAAADRARAIVRSGIPVMGHVGLTPQTATALGGFKAQGRTASGAIDVYEDALALQAAGCFSIVVEAVPAAIAEAIASRLDVPTIGIGAGTGTSGQVLVLHDLVGINSGPMPKFVKRYSDTRGEMRRGMEAYVEEVRNGTFPAAEHIYSVPPAELDAFQQHLDGGSLSSPRGWDWEPLS